MTPASAATEQPLGVLSRTFRAFRYRDFRIVWTGAFTSTTGTWMQNVAQSWLVFSLTGSAFYLGFIGFLSDLPILLFSLVGGVVADRLDRRKLLLGSQYVQMTAAFILTALVLLEWVRIWHIMLLVFMVGTAQSFGGPAYQALIPGLVKREDVPNAIALNSIQFNLARVIGPALAGITFAAAGAAFCFFINGLSFIAVIIGLSMIQATFNPQKTTESVMEGMRGGFAFVRASGSLWQLSVLGFVSTFCGIPLLTLLPVFARDVFQIGATGYASMMATSGLGAITGALLYAGASHSRRRGKIALGAQLLFAMLLAIFALSRYIYLSYAALFFGGVCLIALFAAISSMVQLATPEEVRGRVMSIFMLAFRGGMPLGNLVFGYWASRVSPSAALLAGSMIIGSTALVFMLSRSGIKKL